MRFSFLTSAAVGAALLGIPAVAAADPAATAPIGAAVAPSEPPKLDPRDEVVCVRQDMTGSRLQAHKVCHTRRQWDQLSADERKDFQDFMDRAPPPNPGGH